MVCVCWVFKLDSQPPCPDSKFYARRATIRRHATRHAVFPLGQQGQPRPASARVPQVAHTSRCAAKTLRLEVSPAALRRSLRIRASEQGGHPQLTVLFVPSSSVAQQHHPHGQAASAHRCERSSYERQSQTAEMQGSQPKQEKEDDARGSCGHGGRPVRRREQLGNSPPSPPAALRSSSHTAAQHKQQSCCSSREHRGGYRL